MSSTIVESDQNVWVVIDKIVAGAVHWGPELKLHSGNNGKQMTCLLQDFEYSCGMTETVYTKLFDSRNKLRRAIMEGHGVSFPSKSLGTFSTKKIQINYASKIPSFLRLFCQADAPAQQVPAQEEIGIAGDQNIPLPAQNVGPPPLSPTVVDLRKRRHITVTNGNNKKSYWVNIPAASEVIHDEQHFRSVCNKLKLKSVLKEIAGSTAQGVYLLMKRLYRTNKTEAMRALESLGLKPFQTLSPAATVAAKAYANISGKALIKLNSFLRYHNHKVSVFAPRSRSKHIKPKHTVPPIHGSYKYKVSLGHPGLFKWVNVRYWMRSPDKVFEARLKNLRDCAVPDPRPLGVEMGPGAKAIAALIQGDHGGDSMKFVQVFIGREGDNQRYCTQLASLSATESHDVLKHTVMTTINEGVRRLNENLLLLVTWGAGHFDFLLVPVGTELNALAFEWVQDNNDRHLNATWANGTANFERTDIPYDHEVQLLRILPFSSGDLAYQFMLLGRHGHCGSKCMRCQLRKADWRYQAAIGVPFDMGSMVADYAQLCTVYDEAPADSPIRTEHATKNAYIKSVVIENNTYGMRGCDALMTNIPIDRFDLPAIHTMLGQGNDMMQKVRGFISTNLEEKPVPPDGVDVSKLNYHKPMLYAWLDMLKLDYHVDPSKFYKGALVGNDIHGMLDNYCDIIQKTAVIFKNPAYQKQNVAADIDNMIDTFLGNMKLLMQQFGVIYMLMSQTTRLTALEIDIYEDLSVTYGKMWRRFFPGCSVPPKMHYVESHFPLDMRIYGCLGIRNEAAVEKMHQTVNQSNRMLSAVRNYEVKNKSMLTSREAAEVMEVQEITMTTLSGVKRPRTPEKVITKATNIANARKARILAAQVAANEFKVRYNIPITVALYV